MRHQRKITRLRNYDYRSNGAYSVTICVAGKRHAFGRIENGVVRYHPFGIIAQDELYATEQLRKNVILDEFMVMPNHVHLILWITNEAPPTIEEVRQFSMPQSGSLGTIVGAYKSAVTRAIGLARGNPTKVWQKGLHDHVIRNYRDLERHRQYIRNNPARWSEDGPHDPDSHL